MSNRSRSTRDSLARLRRLRQGRKPRPDAQDTQAQDQHVQAQHVQDAPLSSVGGTANAPFSETVDLEAGEAVRPALLRPVVLRRRGLSGLNRGILRRHKSKRGDWRVRSVRWLGPLVVLGLLMIAGGRYVRQSLDVEDQVRRILLPQLQKQLGVPIEVGRIESDYLSRVTLHDVVIGRDKRLPLGALLQAPSIRLDLDLIALALRQGELAGDPLRALSGVFLQSPQLVLSRDKRGTFNFERLLKTSGTSGKTRWSGRVGVANGRVWFRDESVRSSRGAVLVADARGIDGEAVFNGQAPTRFKARLMSTHVRSASLPAGTSPVVRAISMEGRADAAGRWFQSDIRWPQASAVLLAQYVFSRNEVVAQGGALGGVVRAAWDSTLPPQRRLMLRGQVSARDVSGFASSLLEPGTRRPLQVANVSGPLHFENSALSSSGLTGRALGSPFFGVGSLVLPEAAAKGKSPIIAQPVFDISLRSDALDTTRLVQVLARAKLLQGAQIGGGRARGLVHIAGDTRGAQVEADVLVPDFVGRHAQAGLVQTPLLHARFQLARDNRSGQATISAPDFRWNQKQAGSLQGRLLQATTRFRFDDRTTAFDAVWKTSDFKVRRANASSRASGTSDVWGAGATANGGASSGNLRFTSDARHQNINAQFSTPEFSAFLPDGVPGMPRMSTHVARREAKSDVSVRGRTLRAALHLRREIATSDTNWDALWSVPVFEARGAGGSARALLLQGRARFGDTKNKTASSDFVRIAARDFVARHPRIGSWQGRSLAGLVVLNRDGTRADIRMTNFTARAGKAFAAMPALARLEKLKTLGARSLRIVAASDGSRKGTWRGAATLAGLDARTVDVAAIVPAAVGRVRDLGTLGGTARFAGIGGPSPVVEGDFSLSRATVQDVALRDVRGNFSLDENRATLSGGRAQSKNGAFLAEASFDWKRNTTALSLRAPRVVLSATQINPLLASQGLAIEGNAVGSLWVSNQNATSLLAARDQLGSASAFATNAPVRFRFDFSLPRALLRARISETRAEKGSRAARNASQSLHLAGARIRGAGVLRQGDGNDWRFGGGATISVARANVAEGFTRLASFDVPLWMRGTRLQNLRLTTRGDLARTAAGFKPDMAGQLQIARAVLPWSRALSGRTVQAKAVSDQAAFAAFPPPTDQQAIPSSRIAARSSNIVREVAAASSNRTGANVATPAISSALPREVAFDDISALFIARANELEVPRFSAHSTGLAASATPFESFKNADDAKASESRQSGARLSGHFALRRGSVLQGQMLAQNLSAARLQTLITDSAPRAVASRAISSRSTNSRIGASTGSPDLMADNSVAASDAKLRGVVFARADLSGTISSPQADIQARLYRGALEASGATLPIDAARAEFALTPRDMKRVTLRDLTIWSRGGRFSASGTLAPAHEYSWGGDLALDLQTRLDGVPLQRLAFVPFLRTALREGEVDGLLSGDGHLSGTPAAPIFEGRAALRLAKVLGVGIEEAATSVRFEQTARGPRLEMTQISAQAGNSTLAGAFDLDAARNEWSAQLQTSGVETDRLLRLLSQNTLSQNRSARRPGASGTASSNGSLNAASDVPTPRDAIQNKPNATLSRSSGRRASLDLPLRGVLRADINLRGVLQRDENSSSNTNAQNANAEIAGGSAGTSANAATSANKEATVPDGARDAGNFVLLPRQGHVRLATDTLRWRGRELGALRADFTVRDGVVQSDLILASASPNQNVDANGESASRSDAEAGFDAAMLRVRGALPLATDERALDASISIRGARISLVREALVEAQGTLRERGQSVPNFDLVVNRLRSMPSIEGRLALDARLTGSWGDPAVAISTHVRQARLGKQDLPMLDADLNFNQGTIEIRDLALRQTFPADEALAADGFIEAKTPNRAPRRDERETVLRIAPGGRIAPDGDISLDAEVLNANLSQLALWLPGLRSIDGRPILRGELSLFTFQVKGKTAQPQVVGSLEAQSLVYRSYSLDRLRVARFDIDNGQLRIERGGLTFVKGGFQSSAAWGRIPWSWGDDADALGPRRNEALEVHLPLQTADFGALSGAFVPALSNVAAGDFKGQVDVSGTLNAPQLAGEMTLRDARFRIDPAAVALDFGVSELSGTVRFRDGNRLEISDLRGRLAPASGIEAPATNNLPAALRDTRAARRAIVNPNRKAPRVAGEFDLQGSIALDLNPDNFVAPGASLAAHRYDLRFALKRGRYSDETYSGLGDVALRLDLKTGPGEARQQQRLRWNLRASGNALSADSNKRAREQSKRDKDQGETSANAAGRLLSIASVHLAPDFASSADAFLRSRFDGSVSLTDFPFDVRDVGRGLFNGTLRLDNEPASPVAPSALRVLEARRLKKAQDEPTMLARTSYKTQQLTKAAISTSSPHMSTHVAPVAPKTARPDIPASATNTASDVQSAANSNVITNSTASNANAAASNVSSKDAPAAEPRGRLLFSRAASSKALLAKIDNPGIGSENATGENAADDQAADDATNNQATQRAVTQKTAFEIEPKNRVRSISQPRSDAQKDPTSVRTDSSTRVAAQPNVAGEASAANGTTSANASIAQRTTTNATGANAIGSAAKAPAKNAPLPNTRVPNTRATSERTTDTDAMSLGSTESSSTESSSANVNKNAAKVDSGVSRGRAPLRVSGAVVVSEAEAVGAPIGAVGVATVLPDGPILDMRLVAGRNVRFTTPTLRAEFIGALDVRGTPRNPNINGRISTRDGQIRFPNAPARISEGEVAVSVSRDPLTDLIRSRVEIDATARGTVGRYRITLAVKGPLDFGSQGTQNLRVDVSSDPPLSQDEAFAQLTGTSVRDFQGAASGKTRIGAANEAYAKAVVSLLSAPLFAGLERSLEEALGFSSITLDYRFSEPLSVQFSKAVGDRVYVTYRRSLSATAPGQPTAYSLRVDYRIKGGLLLGVQTDERGRRQLTLDRTFRF